MFEKYKYQEEIRQDLIDEALELKCSIAETQDELLSASTIEELEEILQWTPLWFEWLALQKREPLIRFDGICEIADAIIERAEKRIEFLEDSYYHDYQIG